MKRLKLFFACLLMAVLSIGQVWAEDVDFSSGNGTNDATAKTNTWTFTNYTIVQAKGASTATDPSASYLTSPRWYKDNTVTITPATNVTITEVVMTGTGANYNGQTMTFNTGSGSISGNTTTWSGTATNAAPLVITPGKQLRVSSVSITYSTGGGTVNVTGVSLNKDEIELEVGATQTLVATVAPNNATDQVVSWSSDDESVATVDENGVVTAEGIGTATITVTTHDGSFTATCDVEVIAAQPKSILNFTAACGGTGTANDGAVWTVTSDGAESNFDSNRGIHYGTGSASVQYIQLTTSQITGTITKVVVNASDATGTAEISVSVGGTDFTCSGETTVTNSNPGVDYTFTGSASGSIIVRVDRGSAAVKAIYVKSIVVTYEEAEETKVATPVISGTTRFYPNTEVTITCGTENAEIRYTTNGDVPTAGSTLYNGAFELTDGATVIAIAFKTGLENSEMASKEFTKLTPLETIPNIFAAATGESTVQAVTFNSAWVVTGVSTNGKNAYLSDGTNGLILYNSSADSEHPVGGLEAGNTLSGTITCSLVKYNGSAEIENFDATGLTKGTGTIGYSEVAIADLSGVNTGSLIQISGLCTKTTVGTKDYYYVDGVQLYNTLFAFDNPTTGSSYNCNGVYVYYKKGENDPINEICPRRAEDIAEQAAKQIANTQWVATSKTVRVGDATTGWWSTSSDGAKTFSSTNEGVATINAAGEITLVAPGTTTLRFSTAETENYYAGPEVSMNLTVKAALPAGGTEFTWDATAQNYADQEVMATVTAAPNPIIAFANTGSNDPKWYNNGSAVRFYKDNSITITAPDNKLLYEISINFVSGYTKTLTTDVETYSLVGTVGTWSGLAKEVTFSNGDGAARLTSINVVYADGTVTELSIADINLKTTDEETALAITKNVDATIIYEGLNTAVATIADNKVTPVGVGSTIVTARIEQGTNYTAAQTTFTITVAAKTIPTLSFPAASYNANLGESFTAPTLTNPAGVTVHYSSDNAAVSVDENTGAITINAEGTAVITATSVETEDYAVGTASYTLNVADPYKDVLTAAAIGKTSYETWSEKTFTTAVKYAGNNTTGTGDKSGTIQMRVQNPSGIVNTSTIGYLKEISATATKNGANTLDIYAKNTAYESSADLYDESKRGTLIGTIAAGGGAMVFEDGFAYSDNYKYIGIKAKGGAVYYDEIVIKWTPAVINKYTVTYKAGEAEGDDVVVPNIEEGTPITLAAADTYSKEGYTFMGWNDGTDTYAAGDSYTVNDDVTFTAQWAQNFTVTYKAGEATGDDVVRTVPAGAYNLESCSFVYANHAFDGWQNGANKYNAGAEVTISENMEFVAQWVEAMAPITVTFTVNVETGATTLYKEGVKISVTDGTFSRDDNYRCYGGATMTIASELGNITNIELTCTAEGTANYGPGKFSATNYTYSGATGTWGGSAASVELAAASQVRMTEIQVTYIPSAYQRNVTAGNFGTICLPFNGTIEGAELLEFVDKDADNIYLGNSDATVQAGKPYVFLANASQIRVTFTDNTFVAASDHNGLYGTYVDMADAELNGKYLISNNLYYLIDSDDCSLKAYRAYFVLSEVPGGGSALSPQRRFAIGNGAPQVGTGIDALNASETPVKMIIDGKMYILRGEKMYDATGRLVK